MTEEQGPRPSSINKAEAQRAYDNQQNNDYGMPKELYQYVLWGLLLLITGDSAPPPEPEDSDSSSTP